MDILWRIYYSDGTTFDNLDGTPEDAPSYGVVVISQPDDKTNVIRQYGFDWYWWRKDSKCWFGGDIWGMHDQLLAIPKGVRAVKQGRTVIDFDTILSKAVNDPDFKKRSEGLHHMEHKKGRI